MPKILLLFAALLLALMILSSSRSVAQQASSHPAGATMKAIRIHEFGGVEVLKYEDAPRPPTPGDGEMLVRVHAAAVNPVDAGIRRGGMGRGQRALPLIPGFDVSGVVEQVGPGVTKFKHGDAIFAFLALNRGGAYAEYAIVREAEAAPKPQKLSHIEAAAVPLTSLTAWQALFDTAKLTPGQSVLIHGGSGGVGTMAVQLAKWKGGKVYATASAKNLELLKQLGADEAIDYTTQRFEEIARNVDVVLDTVGRDTQQRSWQTLKDGGVLVSIVGPATPPPDAKDRGVRGAAILVKPDPDELTQIARLIDDGKLKPVVSAVLPVSEAAKAHELIESRHTRGKIVLKVIDD
jgi:NADPH:quinone reductase-like Zn-dependent oxidoreductase